MYILVYSCILVYSIHLVLLEEIVCSGGVTVLQHSIVLEQDGRTLERDVERLMRVPSYRVSPRGGGRRGECEGGGGESRRVHVGEG